MMMNATAIVDIAPIKMPLIKRDDLFGGSVERNQEKFSQREGNSRNKKSRFSKY